MRKNEEKTLVLQMHIQGVHICLQIKMFKNLTKILNTIAMRLKFFHTLFIIIYNLPISLLYFGYHIFQQLRIHLRRDNT